MSPPRIAVVGHVEHVTLGRVDGLIEPGGVLHLTDTRFVPGGGGGIAFAQLCRSEAEIHLFTAVGSDEAGRAVLARISFDHAAAGGRGHAVHARADRVRIHAATRPEEHPRVVVVVDREKRRTIFVTREPLHAAASDPLPWSVLAGCDAAYFTGTDPESLRIARGARRLVVSARRNVALAAAAVAPDVVVGSVQDPRENRELAAYDPAPEALVLTDGARPIRVARRTGVTLVDAPPAPRDVVGDYGAGDSFAAALTFFLAHGLPVEEACARAGPHGSAVLAGLDPLEVQARLVAPDTSPSPPRP